MANPYRPLGAAVVWLVVFASTFVGTMVSSMSGGGASVLNLPVLLSLGVSFPVAVSIQRMSTAFWVLPAARNYLKGRRVDWQFLLAFAGIGLIGAYAGVVMIVRLPERAAEMVIGVLIMVFAGCLALNKNAGTRKRAFYSRTRRLLAYPFGLLLGFYQTIFGVGSGQLIAIVTFYTRGLELKEALGYALCLAFPWVTLAAAVLAQQGYFDLELTIPAVAGSMLGGYVGSRYAKKRGNGFIKWAFVVTSALLGLKLVLGI